MTSFFQSMSRTDSIDRCRRWVVIGLAALLLAAGCGAPGTVRKEPPPARPGPRLPQMRYSIQAGAFKNINNAVRLTQKLLSRRLDAYHFIDESGFYKVRIGNFPSREDAMETAERLITARIIEEYFLVAPQDYAAAHYEGVDEARLRQEIIRTAKRFIGVPYQWGGETSVSGFDCSGLTMVVYQLNGLELPRTSIDQWQAGRPVGESEIAAGDLVFFATRSRKRVSHVGIYLGGESFLHAPGRGNTIQIASLSADYFKSRYLGARAYL
jgi:hypothetical protein